MARGLVEVIPRLGHLKVVRQWAGPYDMSPDGDPAAWARRRRCPASSSAAASSGHGFMMAPVVARHYALHLTGKATHPLFQAWNPARFAAGAPTKRGEDFNIG